MPPVAVAPDSGLDDIGWHFDGPGDASGASADAASPADAGLDSSDAQLDSGGDDRGDIDDLDGGCSVGWDDCESRCAAGRIEAGTAAGVKPCACGRRGEVDLTQGCVTTDDCALVRADCCGCGSLGRNTAVLKVNAGIWEAEMERCCVTYGCLPMSVCGDLALACEAGRCIVRRADAGGP